MTAGTRLMTAEGQSKGDHPGSGGSASGTMAAERPCHRCSLDEHGTNKGKKRWPDALSSAPFTAFFAGAGANGHAQHAAASRKSKAEWPDEAADFLSGAVVRDFIRSKHIASLVDHLDAGRNVVIAEEVYLSALATVPICRPEGLSGPGPSPKD
ncbi:MAG: hypothetical protein LQ346_001098 [Caloplaca aetnensis]|nr:MAG: hypothetical protein LQ346_001098 [Caloplaca aetnensis]